MASQRLSIRAFWGLAGWALPLFVIFLIAPRLLATAGAERFGVLMICFVVPLIAAQLDFGIGAAAARRFAAELGSGRIDVSTAAAFGLVLVFLGILIGAITILLARPLSDYLGFSVVLGTEQGTSLLRWCSVWGGVALGCALPMIIARAAQRLAWTTFTQTGMTVMLWIGALQVTKSGAPLDAVVMLGVSLSVASSVLSAMVTWRHINWGARLQLGLKLGLQHRNPDFRFSLGSFVSQLAGIVVYQGDRVLVAALGSPAAAGAYALCTNLANKILASVVALTSFVLPHASSVHQRQGLAGVEDLLHALDRSIVAFVVPLLVVALGLAAPFLSLWLKDFASTELIHAFRLLAIAYTAVALVVPVSHVLAATGSTRLAARYSWLTATVMALSMIVLVPRFGLIGAAISVLAAMLAGSLFNISARRALGIGVARGKQRFWLGVLLGVTVQGAVMVLFYRFADNWPGLVAVTAITWAAFYGARAIFRGLSPEEERFLKRLGHLVSQRTREPG